MSSKAVTDAQFQAEVLNAPGPVVVDFWAEWCGPCKALSPVLDEIAGEMKDTVTVVKVNIEDSPETPTKYGVRGIPTLMVFKNGAVVAERVGGLPKAQLSEWIKNSVGG